MSNPKFNLPEPVFPEHALIRDSAPVPQLSAGFKSRVMSECRVSTAKAVQVRRWKYAGGAAAVCCLGVLFCLLLPNGSQSEPVPVAEQHSPVSPSSGSPSTSAPSAEIWLTGAEDGRRPVAAPSAGAPSAEFWVTGAEYGAAPPPPTAFFLLERMRRACREARGKSFPRVLTGYFPGFRRFGI